MDEHEAREARAHLRFAVVGGLLAAPPPKGELTTALKALAMREWRDPVTGNPLRFSERTIEGWYYRALKAGSAPVDALRRRVRRDRGHRPALTEEMVQRLRAIRADHPRWTMKLVHDEMIAQLEELTDTPRLPSYSTTKRYMRRHGLQRKRKPRGRGTKAPFPREARRFEAGHVNGLWHLDFHFGSRRILVPGGRWETPILLCVLDDRSRLACHAQWYLREDTEHLVHGFAQALMRRGLPRSLMSDNGAAMTGEEFTKGLSRLGVVHETTLPYHPNQNGKQERFFGTLEGRLMALLEGEKDLSLEFLNEATHAWIECDYHVTSQPEMAASPRARFARDADVRRDCPSLEELRQAFTRTVTRRPRKETATITIDGVRFEIPSAWRHVRPLHVRYRRWDLTEAWIIDDATGKPIIRIRPEDTVANADGLRRSLGDAEADFTEPNRSDKPRPALLRRLLAEYSAHGLPPGWISKEND